ncbi:MAG TPA: GspE/PulE family protein [Polyangiaceae bacterium]|nr:GspE/PulE family protein [Polyangiaceae bacterium]
MILLPVTTSGALRALVGLGVTLWVAGALMAAISASSLVGTEVSSELAATAEVALTRGIWLELMLLCGLLTVLLVVGALAAWIFRTTVAARLREFPELGSRRVSEGMREAKLRIESCLASDPQDIVSALNELLRGAVAIAASDIHLSPTPAGLKLTYRVDGTLHELMSISPALGTRLVSRAKVLGKLDTHIHGVPQDGHLVVQIEGARVDARVSTLPTDTGERMVMRLVRGGRKIPEIEALGFEPRLLHSLRELLSSPQGLLFVTGPVGSGKTTTLYAALQHIVKTRGRTTTIVTLEDPIELELPFATQTQMHPRAGMTFAATLRSVLRQDPNVLMVGEIRDRETADIATQAGLTGHLILTTVHADNAAGPFARLMELGAEPFVLASACVGSLSQRLVRSLCSCRREAPPSEEVIARLGKQGAVLPHIPYYEPVGCPVCDHEGFIGRLPIAELLVITPELRTAIHNRKPGSELYALAAKAGAMTLLDAGLERAKRGETSLSEVVRVAG